MSCQGIHHELPDFLVKLGVLLPCNEQDVKEAYLSKVRKVHPDVGGDVHEFLEVQKAYESALEYARIHATRLDWLATQVLRYVAQQQVIATIEKLGGQVELEPVPWLAQEIGEDFAQVMDRLVGIRCQGPTIDDRMIDVLVHHQDKLGHLQKLDFTESNISDEGLLRLWGFTNLRELNVNRTHITNAGLKVLNDLAGLEWLGLEQTSVNWFGFLQLSCFRSSLQVSTGSNGRTQVSLWLCRLLFGFALLYFTAMFLTTHMRLSEIQPMVWIYPLDKWVHAAMYGGGALLSAFLLLIISPMLPTGYFRRRRSWGLLGLGLAVYALLDEVTQPVMGRHFDWFDWTADLAGILAGLLAFQILVIMVGRYATSVWRLPWAELKKIEIRQRLRRQLFADLST